MQIVLSYGYDDKIIEILYSLPDSLYFAWLHVIFSVHDFAVLLHCSVLIYNQTCAQMVIFLENKEMFFMQYIIHTLILMATTDVIILWKNTGLCFLVIRRAGLTVLDCQVHLPISFLNTNDVTK